MTEEQKTRPVTVKEKDDLVVAIKNSKEMIPIMQFKLKHATLMLTEGLENNYKEARMKLESDIANLTSKIMFEEKVVKQYEEILAKGEMSVSDIQEE
jgi:hypothetical protein